MLDSKEIYKELKAMGHFDGVYYRILKVENGIKWAIVFGWHDNTLEGKFAYNDTALQCDYDLDWLMPFANTRGDVYDTNIEIETENDIIWLIEQAKEYNTELYNL